MVRLADSRWYENSWSVSTIHDRHDAPHPVLAHWRGNRQIVSLGDTVLDPELNRYPARYLWCQISGSFQGLGASKSATTLLLKSGDSRILIATRWTSGPI